MSAPPIGMMSSTPKISDSAQGRVARGSDRRSREPPGPREREQHQVDEVLVAMVIGRVGMISRSLPAAISDPVNVRKPRMTSSAIADMRNVVNCTVAPHDVFAVPTGRTNFTERVRAPSVRGRPSATRAESRPRSRRRRRARRTPVHDLRRDQRADDGHRHAEDAREHAARAMRGWFSHRSDMMKRTAARK